MTPSATVFVVSDGTGITGDKVIHAALEQFPNHGVDVRRESGITTESALADVIRRAAGTRALVMTTLVAPAMRSAAAKIAREHGVPHVDLIGDLVTGLSRLLQMEPTGQHGLTHHAGPSYFQRVEALEFTVRADDGQQPHILRQSDIVLLGVSRTGKTPLSTYLAQIKGYKVSNVPIVLDRPLPATLDEVDPRRVVGLTIDPSTLQSIRRTRLAGLQLSGKGSYAERDYILAELEYAESLFRSHPHWPVIDVTDRAVEETAAILVDLLQERGVTPTSMART